MNNLLCPDCGAPVNRYTAICPACKTMLQWTKSQPDITLWAGLFHNVFVWSFAVLLLSFFLFLAALFLH